MKYTTVQHDVRLKFNLTMNDYAVIDCIYHLQLKKGWCNCSKEYLSKWLGISSRSIFVIIKKLEERKLLKRNKQLLKTTKKWYAEFSDYEKIAQPDYEESSHQTMKKVHSDYEESSHNNKTYIKKDIKEELDSNLIVQAPEKKEYGNEDLNLIMQKAEKLSFAIQGTKTYNRRMAWNLYKKFGLEKTIKSIEYAAAIRGQPYAPIINDFGQLYKKIGDLICFYEKEDKTKLKFIKIR